MPKRTLKVERLGRVEYGAGLDLQKQTERAVLTGAQPDTLLLLEHPHTLTLGRRATGGGITASEQVLQERGVTVFETNRGGKVTYHGLGQIVGYPIIKLSPDREDVHRFVRDLEEVLMRTMNDFDIEAFRIAGLTGVHTQRGKVAAIGVHIARWVTTHGFALNVNTDLSYFDLIIACEGEPVTSMKEMLGREVEVSTVEDRIIEHFAEVFDMNCKQEEVVMSRFKNFLQKHHGIRYSVTDQDVPSDGGKRNFDYELRGQDGSTVALEITSLNEEGENIGARKKWAELAHHICEDLNREIEGSGISGLYNLTIPSVNSTPTKMRAQLKSNSVRDAILDASRPLTEKGDKTVVSTVFGPISIERIGGAPPNHYSGTNYSNETSNSAEASYQRILSEINRLIKESDSQLNALVDKRILLIESRLIFGKVFLEGVMRELRNTTIQANHIDEIYIERSHGIFQLIFRC
ncbi:MAG: lipoyl(octanoyl) transferase [Blastocatellia bacterium]|jgi:lipoyl(octanoyl) transferase|nr:lipoyl(octanoyl) transferase [Blastocatellia bacterium]